LKLANLLKTFLSKWNRLFFKKNNTMAFAKNICYVKYFSRKFMSGAEFEKRDKRGRIKRYKLIPCVSRKTIDIVRSEFLPPVTVSVDHLVSRHLERIRAVDPIVVEYIDEVAGRSPEGLDPIYVARAGILVYRLLELEFERRGKKMPIVGKEIADSLRVDILQEEGYFDKLANSLRKENFELFNVLALYPYWLGWASNDKDTFEQVALLVLEIGLGVYELIKAQAKVDRLSGL